MNLFSNAFIVVCFFDIVRFVSFGSCVSSGFDDECIVIVSANIVSRPKRSHGTEYESKIEIKRLRRLTFARTYGSVLKQRRLNLLPTVLYVLLDVVVKEFSRYVVRVEVLNPIQANYQPQAYHLYVETKN